LQEQELQNHLASKVNAPLINECYANLECRIVDARMAAKYNFFILEVIKAWIDPSRKQPLAANHPDRNRSRHCGFGIC